MQVEESISGESSGIVLNKVNEKSYRECLKGESITKVQFNFFASTNTYIRVCSSILYVGLAHAVSPTNTNLWLTFLLTRLQEALYEDLPV